MAHMTQQWVRGFQERSKPYKPIEVTVKPNDVDVEDEFCTNREFYKHYHVAFYLHINREYAAQNMQQLLLTLPESEAIAEVALRVCREKHRTKLAAKLVKEMTDEKAKAKIAAGIIGKMSDADLMELLAAEFQRRTKSKSKRKSAE